MTELRKVGKTVNVNIDNYKLWQEAAKWVERPFAFGQHPASPPSHSSPLVSDPIWAAFQCGNHSATSGQNITLVHSRNTDHHCGQSFGKHQISEQARTIWDTGALKWMCNPIGMPWSVRNSWVWHAAVWYDMVGLSSDMVGYLVCGSQGPQGSLSNHIPPLWSIRARRNVWNA